MTRLGQLSYFLGMEFCPTKEGILLHQKKYAKEVLKKLINMFGCNPVATPMEVEVNKRLVRKNMWTTLELSIQVSQCGPKTILGKLDRAKFITGS